MTAVATMRMDVEQARFNMVEQQIRPWDVLKPQSIPQAVIILADYQYKNAFVADTEINLVACLTELMVTVEFK